MNLSPILNYGVFLFKIEKTKYRNKIPHIRIVRKEFEKRNLE